MNLTDHNPIIAEGSYDIPLVPGTEYLVTAKGTWTDTGTITLQADNGPAKAFEAIENGALASDATEVRLVAPSGTLRLVAAGFTGDPELQITVMPIHRIP